MEDYSICFWYKGEKENPYTNDQFHPLAASFWEYERDFYSSYRNAATGESLVNDYKRWKEDFITNYLPGKSPNPYGDTTDWGKVFETGKR